MRWKVHGVGAASNGKGDHEVPLGLGPTPLSAQRLCLPEEDAERRSDLGAAGPPVQSEGERMELRLQRLRPYKRILVAKPRGPLHSGPRRMPPTRSRELHDNAPSFSLREQIKQTPESFQHLKN